MIEELMAHLLDVNADENWDDLEYLFYEKYNIDQENFERLINELLPMIEVAKSPLTKQLYKGFANRDKEMWLVRIEVKNND